MNNRDATDTIKGYFYQFDHYIMEILKNSNENTRPDAPAFSEK